MNPNALSTAIAEATRTVIGARDKAVAAEITDTMVALERPKNRDHGDWATSIAMKVATRVDMNPRDVAAELHAALSAIAGIKSVDIAGPGFLNITLDAAAAGEIARTIVTMGAAFGHNDTLGGQSINLEFVSANPTGPLHIGHTRWAGLGDSIGRVLRASGATVASEF